MPASLLPDALHRSDGELAAIDASLDCGFAGWPHGHPAARLLEEYLHGRSRGVLDISGRALRIGLTDEESAGPAPGSPARWAGAEPARPSSDLLSGPIGVEPEGPVPGSSTGPVQAEPARAARSEPPRSTGVAGVPIISSGTAAEVPVTVVLDDPDGALGSVVALTAPGRVFAYADSLAARAAAEAVHRAHPDSSRIVHLPVRVNAGSEPSDERAGDPAAADAMSTQTGSRSAADGAATSAEGSRQTARRGSDADQGHAGFAELAAVATQPITRVVLAAPKSLRVLTEYLEILAPSAAEFVVVGRDKHLSRSINTELARLYPRVDVSPGQAKSRLLIASGAPSRDGREADDVGGEASADTAGGVPVPSIPAPRIARAAGLVPEVPALEVSAYGACFGGPSVDPGSALLLTALRDHVVPGRAEGQDHAVGSGPRPDALGERAGGARQDATGVPLRVLDLGCGNGSLLAALGHLLPEARLTGVDVSRAAVASARATCGTRTADIRLVDATNPLPWGAPDERESAPISAGSVDLVVLNPPFHSGHTIETATAHTLIQRARELLVPGGRMVCVFNSSLRYRPVIDRAFGNSEQWARDRRFTVIAAQVPPHPSHRPRIHPASPEAAPQA